MPLLAPINRPLSALVAELPRATQVQRELRCPWALKGLVMRVLNERFAGRDVDVTDGIRVRENGATMQVLPDPDEPVLHLYAEADTEEGSRQLLDELAQVVDEIMEREGAAAVQG